MGKEPQEGTAIMHIKMSTYELLCQACDETGMSKVDMLTKIIKEHFFVDLEINDLDESD